MDTYGNFDELEKQAIELIKAGLQSGTIKLGGAVSSGSPAGSGTNDANYLSALYAGLKSGLAK